MAVGDWVEIDLTASVDAGWILKVHPRKTKLSRRPNIGAPEQILVSNADQLLMVNALHNPAFRYGLVDRLLVAGSCGGLEALLVLTKADLVTSAQIDPIIELYSKLGYEVIVTSAVNQTGLEQLREMLYQKISVLSGHSGVGKSSLVKALFPDWEIGIGHVNEKIGKGRHTTRMAEMFRIPEGAFLVDTPGIRELEPLVTAEELDQHFVEFAPFLGQCFFKGCSHHHEPRCEVKNALEAGEITQQRYKSYCSIYESL